jgi:hypothetical protein
VFDALDFAVSFPERLRSLVVANAVGGGQDQGDDRSWRLVIERAERHVLTRVLVLDTVANAKASRGA